MSGRFIALNAPFFKGFAEISYSGILGNVNEPVVMNGGVGDNSNLMLIIPLI